MLQDDNCKSELLNKQNYPYDDHNPQANKSDPDHMPRNSTFNQIYAFYHIDCAFPQKETLKFHPNFSDRHISRRRSKRCFKIQNSARQYYSIMDQ